MNLSQDYYYDFFDLTEAADRFDLTKKDFTTNLAVFLEQNGIMAETALAISRALFERMADRSLHYHTPVHVLSMLQFAEKEGIRLEDWEQLTIWFHDAIYLPQMPGTSEMLSAKFMRAMVETAFNETTLAKAQLAIETTAHHLEVDTNPLCDKILDLDLSHFAGNCLEICNACIRKEFAYVDDAVFEQRRKQFFERLLGRGFIYRSAVFKERYEAVAMKKLKNEVETLDGN